MNIVLLSTPPKRQTGLWDLGTVMDEMHTHLRSALSLHGTLLDGKSAPQKTISGVFPSEKSRNSMLPAAPRLPGAKSRRSLLPPAPKGTNEELTNLTRNIRIADLVVADVTLATIDLGSRLGLALAARKLILCLYLTTVQRPTLPLFLPHPFVEIMPYKAHADFKPILSDYLGRRFDSMAV